MSGVLGDDMNYGILPEDRKILNCLKGEHCCSVVYDRTSPTTDSEQRIILARYIQDAQNRGVDIKIYHEMVPIDSLTPIHLELDIEQLGILEPIYGRIIRSGNKLPPAIVEVVGGGFSEKRVLLDGHHRAFLSKYRFNQHELYASVLNMGTRTHDTNIGMTFGELSEDNFILC